MFYVAFTPRTNPANALHAKAPKLMAAFGELFGTLDTVYDSLDEWFVGCIFEAAKEAADNLEDGSKPAKGTWSDMGMEDDSFSIDIFCADDVRFVKLDDDILIAPHGAIALAIGEHNHQEWIYSESDLAEWDNFLKPVHELKELERCEHTGMTRDELESICGRAEPIIESIDRQTKHGDCTLIGFFSDNAERKLFSFYTDELTFDDSELIGKTETEAHHLLQRKTAAYLQA